MQVVPETQLELLHKGLRRLGRSKVAQSLEWPQRDSSESLDFLLNKQYASGS